MTQIQTKPGPKDLLEQMSPEMYRQAYASGQSLSGWLERQNPSAEYKDGLDAFSRLLQVADIRTHSFPEDGIYASTWEEWHTNEQARLLIHEWTARQWRKVAYPRKRALYTSQDITVGSVNNPWRDALDMRWDTDITPAIPLNSLVAITTPIQGDAYRSYYLVDAPAEQRMVRVGEGAEIPRAKLTAGEKTIRMFKYGRAIEATYEQLRRQRIDRIAAHVRRMALQAEADKVATALDVLINGDGNAGTSATNYNLTTLDSAGVAGTLTLKAWLAFKLKFKNPYAMTTALVQEAVALQLMLLNTGSANIPLVMIAGNSNLGGFRQINPSLADNVALGWTDDAPALKIVGFDSRQALERVTEIGGNIEEIEKFAIRQTQALILSEIEGYAIFDPNATKTLNVNA